MSCNCRWSATSKRSMLSARNSMQPRENSHSTPCSTPWRSWASATTLDSDGDHGDRTWDAVAAALAYYLREGVSPTTNGWQGYGSFGPMWIAPVGDGRSNLYPAEPAKVPEETREVWRALAVVETLDPLVRGRICDLLWELSDGPRPYAYAEAAVSCHLEHSRRENAAPSGRDKSARRAAALAATLNNRDAALRVVARDRAAGVCQLVGQPPATSSSIVVSGLQALVDHTHAKRHAPGATRIPTTETRGCAPSSSVHSRRIRHPVEQEELLDLAMAAAEDEQDGPAVARRADSGGRVRHRRN